MRIVLVVVAIILVLGGSAGASVQDAVGRLVDPDRDSGTALKDASALRAREVVERVEEGPERIEEVTAQKASQALGSLKEAALETVEQAQDRAADARDSLREATSQQVRSLADWVKQAAADRLQQASDELRELASRLGGP